MDNWFARVVSNCMIFASWIGWRVSALLDLTLVGLVIESTGSGLGIRCARTASLRMGRMGRRGGGTLSSLRLWCGFGGGAGAFAMGGLVWAWVG